MNEHLKSVRMFHEVLSLPQAAAESNNKLPDMEAIKYQALLMEAGSQVLKAIKAVSNGFENFHVTLTSQFKKITATIADKWQ